MEKLEQLYEGKAKKVFKTDDENQFIIEYKDDATAGNGAKKGTISGKGVINNKMTAVLFPMLEAQGIPTHFIEQLSDTEQLVKAVTIFPLEVIVRNTAAGSFSKRLGVTEGTVFEEPIFEFSYKNDDYGDPFINDDYAVALKLATREEIATIREYTLKLNAILKAFFLERGVNLIDFKVEYGKTNDGTIVLADEISPDTCRFWDVKTGEKLDKDRFRRDMGGIEEAYQEMMKRVNG
ncbi:MAG: phosphoribosylaminoimidazolesuccinocarboxamide synthase [Eubacterium aggregans]|jgi:phosphoribosylaminoimidazole-succinocarboxamide synthase|uniref:Phosphoribosylaminoimidazole-succinocarboxamide synthase n=1 Tax=Eubacterium aggregans TaxID=81409 RepID=A0A1H3YP35_9FIRM|nr:phosphoribosylaminoimidazolesuccinocarboxamide synthase [Eubacterium aggregans]MDD4691747.1 phosphoribosylaminoimidazolesuccinocarboxamide synthase [Eubacterium aggregans]MEA5073578.1 phosphoribosylaminoimidazolesuccinocarboxamide synthase [Eubacterium aggregans]SEA13270.1 phosphoribosylaminoimidazole-succinocarboxamide synthase [Eubacterium aggregans]